MTVEKQGRRTRPSPAGSRSLSGHNYSYHNLRGLNNNWANINCFVIHENNLFYENDS